MRRDVRAAVVALGDGCAAPRGLGRSHVRARSGRAAQLGNIMTRRATPARCRVCVCVRVCVCACVRVRVSNLTFCVALAPARRPEGHHSDAKEPCDARPTTVRSSATCRGSSNLARGRTATGGGTAASLFSSGG